MIKELWQIINPFIRVLLMNTVTLCIFLEITGLLTGKKKTWRFFYGYIFIRAFVIRFLVDGIWRHYYLHETWWKLLLFILMVLNGFLLYLLCLFIFQGSPLKVAISAWSGEVLASAIMLCANTIINSLEGRPLNAMIYLPLQPLDLLAAPLELLLFALFYKCFAKKLLRFRSYEPKHRKLLWFLYISYILVNIYACCSEAVVSMDMEWSGIFPILGSMTLFGAIGFGFFWLHRRKVQAENEYLRMQQRLLESYYYEISSQIQKVRRYQKVMDAQMEQILALDEEQLTDGRLTEYLGELRAQYQEVTTGIYCNHWAMDALLTQTEKRCRQEGIHTDFLFQEYDGGDLDAGEILFLLQKLLELALQNAKAVPKTQTPVIRLHAATVRNQLVFSLAFSAPAQARISPRPFRRWTRPNKGNLQITRTKDGYTILLTLQKE